MTSTATGVSSRLGKPATADRPIIEPGIVAVYRIRTGNSYAVCSCGWSGSRRLLKAAACQDAWAHAAQNRCEDHYPMVLPVV
jgi:hypothetical protein